MWVLLQSVQALCSCRRLGIVWVTFKLNFWCFGCWHLKPWPGLHKSQQSLKERQTKFTVLSLESNTENKRTLKAKGCFCSFKTDSFVPLCHMRPSHALHCMNYCLFWWIKAEFHWWIWFYPHISWTISIHHQSICPSIHIQTPHRKVPGRLGPGTSQTAAPLWRTVVSKIHLHINFRALFRISLILSRLASCREELFD